MRDDARIAKLVRQLRDAVAKRITEFKEERAVAAQVKQRKQLASQLQLSERLLTIYKEVKDYPRRRWARNNPADVGPLITDVDVVEEEDRSGGRTTVRFSLKSRCYSFLFDIRYSSPVTTCLTLSGASDEALFRVGTRGETSAFVPGDWILDFIELSEAIVTIEIERDRSYRLFLIENQKRDFIESQERDFGLGVLESEVQKLQTTLRSHGIGEARYSSSVSHAYRQLYGVGEERHSAGTAARSTGRWLRRLFGRRHDGR